MLHSTDGATYFASAVSYVSKMFMQFTTCYIRPGSKAAQISVTVFTQITIYVVGNNETSYSFSHHPRKFIKFFNII
jgi:hypothetical protein